MNSHEYIKKEKKKFSLIGRIQSANHALRGLGIFFRLEHSSWFVTFFALLAIYLGFVLNISSIEWLFIVLAIGVVFITETLNTAIEIDIDLTSPQYHPYARDTKDVAAGATLLSTVVSIIVGLIIFLPKILDVLK